MLSPSLDDRVLSSHMSICPHTVSRISVPYTFFASRCKTAQSNYSVITAVGHYHDINVNQRQTLHLFTHLTNSMGVTSKLAYLNTFICMQ